MGTMTAEEALALANQYTDEHGGGGGGTSDYSQLSNQPKVNNVTLIGNKTTEDLIPIGDGLNINADGELEATGGSDVLVIEAVIYNETPELYSISFGKSLTEIVRDIEGVNGNAIVKIWTTSSKLKCYLSETFNDDGSGNWVTNVRRYSNNYDIVCRDILMIGYSSDNKKSVWKYPLQKNLTFDNQPTKNSTKPVTSDGIYRQIESRLKNHTPWLTAQNASTIGYERINLFNLTLDRIKQLNTDGTWADNVYTHNGVTFTVNHTDGVVESIVTNGTASSNDAELIVDDAPINADATYYVNGCAAGGGATKYGVNCVITDQTHSVNDSWALYDDTDEWEVTARVIGYFKYTIFVYVGESANNKEFYPMLSVYENNEFVPSVPTIDARMNGLDTRVQILENGGDRSLNYSTSEQVVGTWIDGKPLYQITKQWQVPSQVAGQWNNYSVGNLGTLDYMNISELAFDYSTSNYRFGNSVGLGTMEVASNFEKVGARLGYNTESGNAFVQLENVGTTSPLYQYGGTLTATIRYTKTTD